MEPKLRTRGAVEQAAAVRRRLLPRFTQLFMAEPHLTNRWLNLFFHARTADVDGFTRHAATLDGETEDRLNTLWHRSLHARGRGIAPAVSTAIALLFTVATLGGLALLVLPSRDDPQWQADASPAPAEVAPDTSAPTEVAPDTSAATQGGDPPGDSAATTPGGVPEAGATALREHVPATFRDTCDSTNAAGALAALDCTPLDDDAPGTAVYYQYADAESMEFDFTALGSKLSGMRPCPGGQTTWSNGSASGSVTCFRDEIGTSTVLWTHDQLAILAYGESTLLEFRQLFRWWSRESGPV